MGYYTRFELTIKSGGVSTDYEKEIEETTGASFGDEIKWYNWKEEMLEYSKKHPKVLFLLDGEGEESCDIWKAYFKNGKMFHTFAKLVFEEFSKDKLK